MEWDPTEFQNMIRELQDRRGGLPRAQIAREAGIKQQTLNRWMQPPDAVNEVTKPQPQQLALLAQVVGAPPYGELMRMCGHMPPDASSARQAWPRPIEALANYLASAWSREDNPERRAEGMHLIDASATAIADNYWHPPTRRPTGRNRRRQPAEEPSDSDSFYTVLQTPALA